MYKAEFMKAADVSSKTAIWLYDHVFHPNESRGRLTHRQFSQEDVDWVMEHKPEYFARHGERLVHLPDSPYYVSDTGKVYNFKRGFLEVQKPYINFGYEIYHLTIGGKLVYYRAGRLIAM